MQQYLTLNDLQKRLGGRSRSAIYEDLKAGRLPEPLRLGSTVLWGEKDLTEFLDEMKTQQGPSDVRDGDKNPSHWSDDLLSRNRGVVEQRRSGMTFQKIADNFNLSRERVRQIIWQHNKANGA